MPVIKSAKKKLRADLRKRKINLKVKAQVKTALKKFTSDPKNQTLSEAYSALDVATKKGIIPKGRADRKKSRLAISFSKSSKSRPKQAKTPKKTKNPPKTKTSSQNG